MAAQKGKDILMKLDESGSGVFVTVAGLRANRISFNTDTIDVTNSQSPGQWRELLTGAGVKNAAVSGSGVFKDSESDAIIRRCMFEDTVPTMQLAVPDFGIIEGKFQITSLEYSGNHDAEATWEIALASAGSVTFTEV